MIDHLTGDVALEMLMTLATALLAIGIIMVLVLLSLWFVQNQKGGE